jgi:N-6 DNA Methylase
MADGRSLGERLQAYGCTDVIRLDEPLTSPAQIEYLDLLPRRGGTAAPAVNAVAEHQGTALLYLLDACGDARADAARLAGLQRQLANRSDPAWLGVVWPGSLELYPIGFHENAATAPLETIQEQAPSAPLLFQSLVHGVFPENHRLKGSDYVFKKIYDLLTQTTDEYVGAAEEKSVLQPLDVLSMAGRALFFRFLVDRKIVRDTELEDICPAAAGLKDTFANAEKAAQTSAWLDETFNGDFLQLVDESIPASDRAARQEAYLRFYKRIERRAGRGFFDHLHAILNGWRARGGVIQQELDWGDLDFAHIPVGVLSQVYESFAHRADHRTARQTSIHYTPRAIARLMVDQAFAAVKEPSRAKVLDPACGAGIFLVLAFRRMVSERWRSDGRRPDTRTIQNILYGHLRGFEVSESALRLAALALYITAIEVNGTQRPPKALKFPKDLRDHVLFHVGDDSRTAAGKGESSTKSSFPLGSLGPRVPLEMNGTFDLVIGNPPWTRLREEEPQRSAEGSANKKTSRAETDVLNEEFTKIGRRVLRDRGLGELADHYENPDKNPDLPFLWRAAEWAKQEDGIIAFVLPARVFGRTTGKGYEAWRAVLRSLSLTGLINGADLRKTAVWESIDMPFCLLFARNVVPEEGHRFYYTSPLYDPPQNRHARFRIDYEATLPLSVQRVERQPWVLKALSLGTWRDVGVMESVLRRFPKTLAETWETWNPERDKTGQGYNRSPGLPQKPADFLGQLLDFAPPRNGFSIPFVDLECYLKKYGKIGIDGQKHSTAYRPKEEVLYQPPLVIIPQSPGDAADGPRAYLSRRKLAFSQSYYGYSCAGHEEEEVLAALLYLLPHSILFSYFSLMTSRRTGFDRQTFNKEEFDALPFPDVSSLPAADKTSLCNLAHRLEHDESKPWEEIDSLMFRLYDLDSDAVQVVRDTLFSAAAYRRKGRSALNRTMRQHRELFSAELSDALDPYFDVCGEKVLVEEARHQPDAWEQPWFFLAISRAGEPLPVNAALLRCAMEEANKRSASRILVRVSDRRGLLLGLLNQQRWWTITRARLCGQHIIRHHLDAFGLTQGA